MAHRGLVSRHRVNVVIPAALRVGVDPRRDPENSHYRLVPGARIQTYRFGLLAFRPCPVPESPSPTDTDMPLFRVKLGEEGNVTNPVGGRVAKGGLSLETVVCL